MSNNPERLILVIRVALIDMTSLPPCVEWGGNAGCKRNGLSNVIQMNIVKVVQVKESCTCQKRLACQSIHTL